MARLDTPKSPTGDQSSWGRCQTCDKICWPSRKAARAHAHTRAHARDQRPYRCPHGLGWHLGHVPPGVRNGSYAKTEYEKSVDRRRADQRRAAR